MALSPIEKIFPRASELNTGIFVTPKIIHGEQGYVLNQFPQSEIYRNHFSSRNGDTIKYLILHYTVINFYETMVTFTSDKPSGRVSAHYVITEKESNISAGQIIQMVQDANNAWHAGPSNWANDRKGNLNSVSLGIELVNKGLNPFDVHQIQTLGRISRNIVNRYNILPNHILGHADIAPLRKQDPGVLFPWKYLYTYYNVGAWLDRDELNREVIISKYDPKEPCPNEVSLPLLLKMLKTYGYDVPSEVFSYPSMSNPNVKAVVTTFKAHFTANQQPELYRSSPSLEDMYWAWALCAKYVQI